MTHPSKLHADPARDLVLDRVLDVPHALVWRAWTEPEHLKKWFCPAPWGVSHCELDLRPGGVFHTTMRSPEGEEFPSDGCFLEVVPMERLAWTSVLGPGFRPGGQIGPHDIQMTAVITITSEGSGTRYVAHVMHASPEACRKHEEMGFHDGWGAATDQLVALAKTLG